MRSWLLACAGGERGTAGLQMHTVIDAPLTADSRGRISCRPMGRDPIEFSWTGPGQADVRTDATGSEALEVESGRYRVVAVDATGSRADVLLDVEPALPTALVVDGYRVTPASTGTARDGTVEALGVGLGEGWRFLWTHGAETAGPVLRDVPCGTYAAIALPDGERVPTLVHRCPPARVTVSTGAGGNWGEEAAAEYERV
jgi:hypothetical protein